MTLETTINSESQKEYNELSLFNITRASIQPGFTYIDAEIRAGNKEHLTTGTRIAGYLIEAVKIGIYVGIISQYL